jgi:hypothetical protein
MRAIRCGRGLGDSLYLQAVVRHLIKTTPESFVVRSDYPDVFRPLKHRVDVTPFSRVVDLCAHYAARKSVVGTTQFEDCLYGVGLLEKKAEVELRIDWEITDRGLPWDLGLYGRPIVLVQLPRAPMGRTDGFGKELLPDCRVIQQAIDRVRDRALIVQIGSGVPLFKFDHIDVDLANKTSVAQLLDVASVASGFIGYVSFMVPLAESFGKPALFVWSARGLRGSHQFIRQITPKKVLQRPSSRFVVDDWPGGKHDEAFHDFALLL